jgi:hypothetical protein
MKKISPKAWGGPGPVRAARRGSKKASTSDPGSKMGLDLSAADRDGAVALGSRQRSSSYDEKSLPKMRFTEPDPILRRQGVMHDLQPIDEEALGTDDSDSIRPAPNLTRSISPFCVDPDRPATPTRKVNLGDMDFMDFLAISEAEMDGIGNRRPSGQSTEKDAYFQDEGVVTVRQPAAVCNELLGREQTRHPEPATVPPRKRRMTILTLGSAVSGAGTQAPDTAFSDFVNLTSTKPLTELTRHEAFWPIMSGKHDSYYKPSVIQAHLRPHSFHPVLYLGILVWSAGVVERSDRRHSRLFGRQISCFLQRILGGVLDRSDTRRVLGPEPRWSTAVQGDVHMWTLAVCLWRDGILAQQRDSFFPR